MITVVYLCGKRNIGTDYEIYLFMRYEIPRELGIQLFGWYSVPLYGFYTPHELGTTKLATGLPHLRAALVHDLALVLRFTWRQFYLIQHLTPQKPIFHPSCSIHD